MSFLGNPDEWPHECLSDITVEDVAMGQRMESVLRFRRIAAVAGNVIDGFVESRAMAAQRWHPGMVPEAPTDIPQPPDDWYPPDFY